MADDVARVQQLTLEEITEALRIVAHNEGVGVRIGIQQAAYRGRLLIMAHDLVLPGKWCEYLKEIGVSRSQACRYVKIACAPSLADITRQTDIHRITDVRKPEREGGRFLGKIRSGEIN